MSEGLFEFVLKLIEHLVKFLNFLPVSPKIAGAISVLPSVIGAADAGWKFLRTIGAEHKKKVLREKIPDLSGFLKSLPEGSRAEDQAQAAEDARREQSDAFGQLARLAIPDRKEPVTEPAEGHAWIR